MSGRFVDLRSDTLSLPTEAMRTAIADAPLGDDQYGEDRLTIEFEQKAAELVGKEAALLVLSGTMGNLVAAMTHSRPGQEVIVGDDTHFYNAEVAGYARVAGLACRPLPSGPQGLDPAAVEAAIRPGSSTHRPTTGLIIVENTNNRGGGTVVTLERMQQLSEVAARHAVPVHIDGARIFEAAVALGVGPDDLCMWGDSVTFCLTKGLSAPLGAALAGSGDFIAAARRNRQMIGGGMRQSGIIAAAGLVALDSMVDRLAVDARHARTLAEGIASVEGLTVDLERVQTNMVYVDVSGTGFSAETVLQSLRELNVMGLSTAPYTIRLCTYQGIDEADIGYAVSAFREIAARGFRPDGINEMKRVKRVMTDKENVVFWRHLDIPNDPVFWGMVRDFNNINPDLHVEMVEVPWNREHEMLVEAAESGNPPDCSDVPEYWLGEFVAKDMLEPLDPFIADWAAAEDFVDGYWGEMGGAPDSPHFVVGGGRGVDILYYRTDIFDSLGLTPPTTLDEFLDAALALTHAPERYGFGMRGSRVGHRFWGDLTRAHGLQFNDDEGNITLNTPEAIEANQWFIDLYSRHRVTPPSAITDSFGEHVEQIAAGKIAMVAHTIHLQAILREELGDKIGAVPMPSGPGGSWTTFYPQNHAIYKGASNKEGAWRFISWLAEAPQVERWCKNPRRPMLPNVKSLMNDPFYRSDPIFEVSINSLPNRGADPWLHPGFGEFVESAWPTTMQRALRGDVSSQEMMESLQAHFDAALTATTSL